MSFITGNIKDILSIKFKNRQDAYTDQFSRIFMTKIFLISAFIMSLDFFNSNISCYYKSKPLLDQEFVHRTCWIQGLYNFVELNKMCSKNCKYFGIPHNIEMDGIKNDVLCNTKSEKKCIPMAKIFFLQYQYFPFYIGSLAVAYYLPYIVFRAINTDIINLKTLIATSRITCPKKIVETYFNYKVNGGQLELRFKTILSIIVKLLYVIVNLFGFLLTNLLLNNKYLTYGVDWIIWVQNKQKLGFHEIGQHNISNPGDVLLPVLALCEIPAASNNNRYQYVNNHKFICEISPNVLYQYVMVVLWFMFILGVLVSCAGFFLNIFEYFYIYFNIFLNRSVFLKNQVDDKFFYNLTLRENEYLKNILNSDKTIYKEVLSFLKQSRVLQMSLKKKLAKL
ncbi:uncharacterized protein LOC124818066 isoform X2 [Hydra vulgaris]|uniref:Innexin n=2 Tax=Hydra vulgaris TaxID=6087 RepID=A0ABM4D812_HYDVU